jgi:hypothetical protein
MTIEFRAGTKSSHPGTFALPAMREVSPFKYEMQFYRVKSTSQLPRHRTRILPLTSEARRFPIGPAIAFQRRCEPHAERGTAVHRPERSYRTGCAMR